MEERKPLVTILAAGTFPTHAVPLAALREAELVVCCDSAYANYAQWVAATPPPAGQEVIAIGDGDSIPPDLKASLGSRFIWVQEQEYNDLTKAMRYVMATEPSARVRIVGATGLREDHTLGNLSLIAYYDEQWPQANVEMLTDYGRLCHVHGFRTFNTFAGQQISLISLTPSMPVSTHGLHWELQGRCLQWWWECTLNRPDASEFSIETEGSLLLFRTYDPK